MAYHCSFKCTRYFLFLEIVFESAYIFSDIILIKAQVL